MSILSLLKLTKQGQTETFETIIEKLLKGTKETWIKITENYIKIKKDMSKQEIVEQLEFLLKEKYMLDIDFEILDAIELGLIEKEEAEKLIKEWDFYKNFAEMEKENFQNSLSYKVSYMARFNHVKGERQVRLLFSGINADVHDIYLTKEDRGYIYKEILNAKQYHEVQGKMELQPMYKYTRCSLEEKNDYELAKIFNNHNLDLII